MHDLAIKILKAKGTSIFSVGQAGFIIKSNSGQLLAIDLYLSECVERVQGHVGFKLFCSTDCATLVRTLQMEHYKSQITYVKPLESYDSGDFHIDFVNCDHGSGAPDAVGVIVTVDEKTIYEASDTCLRLDRIREIPQPLDVLIAPINGAYGNLNEEECSVLAEHLKPRITIPCHYGMFASHHGDVGKFYDVMTKKELPFLLMQQGEQYVF